MFKVEKLAVNIKKSRINMGLTQLDLAGKLFVSSQAISKWESGQSVPDLENLCALAEIFATSVDKLLGNDGSESGERLFIGIDGGATKTEFLLFTESGKVVNRVVLEGCNPNACGMENTQSILKSGIDSFLSVYPDVAGVFIGMAGYFSGNNSSIIDKFLKKTYPLLNIRASSDISNVIASATDLKKCVAVICGTGFCVYASVDNKLSRAGGWGYLLDCMGGGFDIGREALRATLAVDDGFGKATIIKDLVEKRIGGKLWDNIHRIYKEGDSFVASFAPVVFEACQSGDEVALEIIDKNAEYIAKLVKFASEKYGCGNNVVMAGSIISKSEFLLNRVKEKLGEDMNIIVTTLPQIYGACVRCCREFGKVKEDFFENFNKSYNSFLK